MLWNYTRRICKGNAAVPGRPSYTAVNWRSPLSCRMLSYCDLQSARRPSNGDISRPTPGMFSCIYCSCRHWGCFHSCKKNSSYIWHWRNRRLEQHSGCPCGTDQYTCSDWRVESRSSDLHRCSERPSEQSLHRLLSTLQRPKHVLSTQSYLWTLTVWLNSKKIENVWSSNWSHETGSKWFELENDRKMV